jgi:multiple sugar transport system permease protein
VATRLAGALPRRFREPGIRGHQALAGWTFIAPVIVILGLFLVVPIAMAAWVSVSDWTGNGSPLGANAHWVGLANYRQLLTTPGLDQSNFGTAMRNNFYYVLLVVPIQTALSLFLAVIVNRAVKGVGFFRTAFYFPSVTSSVAITVLFLFLFAVDGPVNKVVSWFGATGPAWFYDPDGLFHLILAQFGVSQSNPPHALANSFFLGISYWDWLAGPSVAMCVFIIMAIFTTSGTFMLLFLAALQGIDESVNEAAALDGASEWKKFRYVTAPMIRPAIFTVVTLGLIGTWQIFDQIYVGTKGQPVNTTLTPAFLSFNASFNNNEWGVGAALAFILFGVIVSMTLLTRLLTRSPDHVPRRRRFKPVSGQGTTMSRAASTMSGVIR